jgi:hypothetical protein
MLKPAPILTICNVPTWPDNHGQPAPICYKQWRRLAGYLICVPDLAGTSDEMARSCYEEGMPPSTFAYWALDSFRERLPTPRRRRR